MNKRYQTRKPMANTVVKISDGEEIFEGSISNVSYDGVLVNDLPAGMLSRRKVLDLTITSEDRVYEVRAIPGWESNQDNYMALGLRLFSVPRGWYVFVARATLPKIDELLPSPEKNQAENLV